MISASVTTQTTPMTDNPYEPPKTAEQDQEADGKRKVKRTLIWMMVCGSIPGLTAPYWGPLSVPNLSATGHLVCGLISIVVLCSMCIYRWRQL